MLIYRLNRVPERNYIKFLQLIGIELQPARPAKAELTFTLDSDTIEYVIVPKGTQVSASEPDESRAAGRLRDRRGADRPGGKAGGVAGVRRRRLQRGDQRQQHHRAGVLSLRGVCPPGQQPDAGLQLAAGVHQPAGEPGSGGARSRPPGERRLLAGAGRPAFPRRPWSGNTGTGASGKPPAWTKTPPRRSA